jgi:hypothetical protein
MGVREAGPRGPHDYLIVFFPSNERACEMQVREEESAWSRIWHETEDFINSTGYITASVITENTSLFFIKLSNQKM